MENSSCPRDGVVFATTHRSAISITLPAPVNDVDAFLAGLVELHVMDFGFRACAENQFCVISIHVTGSPETERRIGFPKAARNRIPEILKEFGKLAPKDAGEQSKALPNVVKTELNEFMVWSIMHHFGFGQCCTISKTALPQFNVNGRLPLSADKYIPQRNAMGAPIKAWQVEFTCNMYNSRAAKDVDGKWVGVNIEEQLISLLPDGLFLDSFCRKQGCIIWLATSCVL